MRAAWELEDHHMTSAQVMQVQVVHSDRDALISMIPCLLEERLIACGQILGPLQSIFFWDGSVQRAEEWLALLKCSETVVDRLIARLAELHSYEVPEILVTRVSGGHIPYLEWVAAQTV
jgi:periplasmic divalent cation tolerance protein